MTISSNNLEKIARLASLDIDSESSAQLTEEINSIMDFVDQLRAVDTSQVEPLCHPLALHQRLRMDEITEAACVAELGALAPLFKDNLYMVPKVIESSN
jgi:aspartyl-tRNA(Asn)/glutamyl-tRNA(Gln) amidotransferase subunit C